MIHKFSQHNQSQGTLTSGSSISYWTDSIEPIYFQPLSTDLESDILIVGGGIAGLSVAYCLSKKGHKVVLIEDGFIGSGETGRTTAHIVNALDDRYFEIENKFRKETARLAAESHTAAIDFIERVVEDENIECEFKRVDGYLFLHPSDKMKTLEDEYEATQRAGIKTTILNRVPQIDYEQGPCLAFPRQAQFHPMKYLRGLTEAIIKNGGQIYTETRAEEIEKNNVKANGFDIKADKIVVATNTPVNDWMTMHTKQHPYRTYVIGCLIPKGTLTPALWWDTGNMNSPWPNEPYHYVRTEPFNEDFDLLICGGEDHKTGQPDKENIPEEDRFVALIGWARLRFPMITDIAYKWSGQVLEPVDSLAFIGRNPGEEKTFIATGDSGNGMTHGTIAGMLISDLITGKQNPWAEIYDPSRITLKATGHFIKEASNMAVQYLDYLSPGDVKSINDVPAGTGAIINLGAKKAAVYRDEKNVLHAYSAICPHLGCVVRWNASEHSFDCPCHGSRFTCNGKLVNGPAINDLRKIILKS
jgi:glycine/D-amino acid oxidase-like deaminating enzyme/nitrite reductase/ring-hydroxylating ferredoxin subunit